jgi:hypothetical protein
MMHTARCVSLCLLNRAALLDVFHYFFYFVSNAFNCSSFNILCGRLNCVLHYIVCSFKLLYIWLQF